MSPPLLAVRAVCKAFPGVQALADVHLTLHAGEVLALIGENGAGKSTLMKVLAGLQRADAGEVRIDGALARIDSPAEATASGIALIHQELSLCDNLTVGGALFLGRELRRGPFLRLRAMKLETSEWLMRVGLDVSADRLIAQLSPGERQMVEIARALRVGARILIMDEPTSSLSRTESERLFELVRELRRQRAAVIYVSHRLSEVRLLADRVMALRDGRNAGEAPGAECDHDRMVAMMVGRQLSVERRTSHSPGTAALAVRGFSTRRFPSAAVDLTVRGGEIVGIAGLLGAGRSELLRALFGVDRPVAGEVQVAGRPVAIHSPRDAIAAGLAFVPEDRKQQGLLLDMSLRENLSLPSLRSRGVLLDRAFEQQLAQRTTLELNISARDAGHPVRNLSGGNQQKVVLGKWLALTPSVLLLDEPTRGIDVPSRQEIYARLHQLAGTGTAILFASSEMEEVLTLADRVLVMREGRITGELGPDRLTEEAVLALATERGAA
jgi:ribose transport system ATP-binding protein